MNSIQILILIKLVNKINLEYTEMSGIICPKITGVEKHISGIKYSKKEIQDPAKPNF